MAKYLSPILIGYGNGLSGGSPAGSFLQIGSATDFALSLASSASALTLASYSAGAILTFTAAGNALFYGGVTAPTLALTSPLPLSSGGTGSATQNFVDLTTAQTIAGAKTFSGTVRMNSAFNLAAHLNQNAANNNSGALTLVGGTKSFTFTSAYNSTPVIQLTEIGAPPSGAQIYLSAVSATGFTITSTVSTDTRTINWSAFGNPN